MEFTEFETKTGTRIAADLVYGEAPLGGAMQPLQATIYLPKPGGSPPPLLVWIHGGGFTGGHYGQVHIRRLARQLTGTGFALATPGYRLGAVEGDLGPAVQARLAELAKVPQVGDPGQLAGPAALAACEDVAAFLRWLEARRDALPLSGRPVLGGSGAGGVTAFNLAFLAPWLGLERPEPAGILSFSGGFAWPGLYTPGRYPVFALHNPADTELGIASIRALSARDPALELLEAIEQDHGALRVHPKEPKAVTFGRIRAMLSKWVTEPAPA